MADSPSLRGSNGLTMAPAVMLVLLVAAWSVFVLLENLYAGQIACTLGGWRTSS